MHKHTKSPEAVKPKNIFTLPYATMSCEKIQAPMIFKTDEKDLKWNGVPPNRSRSSGREPRSRRQKGGPDRRGIGLSGDLILSVSGESQKHREGEIVFL